MGVPVPRERPQKNFLSKHRSSFLDRNFEEGYSSDPGTEKVPRIQNERFSRDSTDIDDDDFSLNGTLWRPKVLKASSAPMLANPSPKQAKNALNGLDDWFKL